MFIFTVLFLVGLCLATWFFLRYFIKNDRGAKEPTGALWGAAGFGLLAAILASILNGFIPISLTGDIYSDTAPSPGFPNIVYGMLLVGIIEETLKFLPLALFIRKKYYFNEVTDGIIYFGIAGLTFGILEDLSYASIFGGGVGLFRIVWGPFLHAGFSAIIGLAFARYVIRRKSIWTVIAAWALAVGVHAMHNVGLSSGIPILILMSFAISLAMNIGVFRRFRSAQKDDEQAGISSVGANKFCRNCGQPNPKQMLYCENCGQVA
jgi:RsiW-degrading membrane proteinase PrsW (M82 family)